MASDYKSDVVWIVRDVMDIKRNVVDNFFGKVNQTSQEHSLKPPPCSVVHR